MERPDEGGGRPSPPAPPPPGHRTSRRQETQDSDVAVERLNDSVGLVNSIGSVGKQSHDRGAPGGGCVCVCET